MATIEIENRPVDRGLYWMQIPLPRRMNYADAESYFASLKGISFSDGSRFGTVHENDRGMSSASSFVNSFALKQILENDDLDIVEWREGNVALIGSNGIVNSLGFYVFQNTEVSVPAGYAKPWKSYVDTSSGRIFKEIDSNGKVLALDQSVQGLGLGIITTIAVFYILGLLVSSILDWLKIGKNNPTLRVLTKAVRAPLKAFTKLVNKSSNAGGKMIDAGGDAGKKLIDAGGDAGTKVATTAGNVGEFLLWFAGGVGVYKLAKWANK